MSKTWVCKACGAALLWVRTPNGKDMPVNVEPVYYIERKAGKQRVVLKNGEVLACEYTEDPGRATGYGYIPHWSSCPGAKAFRRGVDALLRERNG